MKHILTAALLFVVVAIAPLGAQWPKFSTPGPKTADGKVDLRGPTPRTPDGKPDLIRRLGNDSGPPRRRAGAGCRRGDRRTAAIGLHLRERRRSGSRRCAVPALGRRAREEADGRQQQGQSRRPLSADGHDADDTRIPTRKKIIQTPTEVVLIYEGPGTTVREVFLDGRTLPESSRSRGGTATRSGRWEGDTLVVETIGFMDDGWLDVRGSPLTSAGKIIERFRRADLRFTRDRRHDRRSEGLHQAVHGDSEQSSAPGYAADRVRVHRQERAALRRV